MRDRDMPGRNALGFRFPNILDAGLAGFLLLVLAGLLLPATWIRDDLAAHEPIATEADCPAAKVNAGDDTCAPRIY